MKKDSNTRTSQKKRGVFIQSIKDSVIISSLDKLCLKIYDLLCTGALAHLFAGSGEAEVPADTSRDGKRGFFSRLSHRISLKIESSRVASGISRTAESVFGLRNRVIGTFLMTYAIFTAIIALLALVVYGTVASTFYAIGNGVATLCLAAASIPFLASKGTLSTSVRNSKIFVGLVGALGLDKDKLWSDEIRGKHWVAFLLGAVAGILSTVIEPMFMFIAIAALVIIYIILAVPEFGLMGIAFLMPFIPTMALAGLTILVAVAFFIKLIRGKRVLRFGKIDFFVAMFTVMLVLGGVVSYSTGSLAPAFLFACFISVYFMISCCVRSMDWIRRIIMAIITSAMLVSLYGIVQYAFGTFGANAWLDSDMFEGITGRAASTLENPNMLGEYLILIIPMAFAAFLTTKRTQGSSRKYTFMCFASMAMCLLLTWSRGAWLGFMFSVVIFLLIWNKRSMWLLAGGVFMLPFLPFILPESIIGRFTSIGNLADSSTSYRLNIWRGSMHMLSDNLFNGIGIGESAWFELYPRYTLPGIEAAPHSHNLFLQIALEHSIFGLIVFLAILLLLLRMSFGLFKRLARLKDTLPTERASSIKLTVAGPLCGLAAVLLQGLTDYSWYNYRVYLIFWLVIGLIPALVKHERHSLDSCAASDVAEYSDTDAAVDINLAEEESSNDRAPERS